MKATRLVELLVQHIAEQGKDVEVMISVNALLGDTKPVQRCWFDLDHDFAVIGPD